MDKIQPFNQFGNAPSEIRWPLEINLIISDLDGTLTPTYMALEAAHLIMHYFGNQLAEKEEKPQDVVNEVADYFRRHIPVENILHEPDVTLMKAARSIAWTRGRHLWVTSPSDKENFAVNAVQLAQQSFRPFDGAERFLQMAYESETYFNIFTNTREDYTAERLAKSGLNPKGFGHIYTRKHGNELVHPIGRAAQAFASRMRSYKKPKPNPEPIRKMQKAFGAKPTTTLMIGEGAGDFMSVHLGSERMERIAHFAFQAQGARMPSAQVETNERLRPGSHGLGIDSVEKECNLNSRRDVINLENGFRTLISMVRRGELILRPTPRALAFAD